MTNAKHTTRRRELLPANQRTSWTRQDLLTLFPFSYTFWGKVPRSVLPYVPEGKNYIYDASEVAEFLVRLKRNTLATLIEEARDAAPQGRKRGRPRKGG